MSSEIPSTTPLNNEVKPLFYVGIGASAGGLEALIEVISRLPENAPMAYMIVQHLSPDFESMMDQLLARRTELNICTVADGIKVEANTIYLMPPKTNMLMAEGKLLLVDQIPHQGSNFPIDVFFRSLAAEERHRSAAIILSGTGTDGSRGLPAIKEVGGLTIVQDPNDAQFDGMPNSAIQTGIVDVVLPASEIADHLVKILCTAPDHNQSGQQLLANHDSDILKKINEALLEHNDIDYSHYKLNTVIRRIERRMRINSSQSMQEYHSLLLENPQEAKTLAKEMLIGVTQFFRDSDAFETLERKIIPAIFDKTPNKDTMRIWVAGCSTGQEAYSIAMLFDEEKRRRNTDHDIKVFATDVDPDAIKEASMGHYTINIAGDVHPDRLSKYFTRDDQGFTVTPELRRMVVFANHNLLGDPPFSSCQLVCCRNLLIYFQTEAQQSILTMLLFALRKEGYLFLGSSETLGEHNRNFTPINERNRIFQKNNNVLRLNDQYSLHRTPKEKKNSPSIDKILNHYQKPKAPNHISALEALITEYIPACIIINGDLDVLHLYGDLKSYTRQLQQGRFSSKVGDYLIEGLGMAATTAIHKAIQTKKTIRYNDVHYIKPDGEDANVDISVLYISNPSAGTTYLALGLSHTTLETKRESIAYDGLSEPQQRIDDLEEALRHNQEHLCATIEELETTNEELQSTNEELMAANEELQSTNEELQSVNEELYSVNSEYQEQIEETTKVNLDIENIIKSADIGFIFLDNAMVIRRFSPLARQHINLIETDIGRPFHHISHTLNYKDLLNDISSVIQNNSSYRKEITTSNSTPLLIKLAPYLDSENTAQGCVISITDTSQIHLLKSYLKSSHAELNDIIATSFLQKQNTVDVLLVDDNEVDLMSIEASLSKIKNKYTQYRIKKVNNFDDAKTILDSENIDVCLLDYKLDGKNGLDLIRSFNDEKKLPAFIILSGEVDNTLNQNAIRLGIYDVIDKAEITSALLERSIRYTMRHKKTEEYLNKLH